MPRRMKELIHRHHFSLVVLTLLPLVASLFSFDSTWTLHIREKLPESLIAVASGVAGAYYFFQKQHLSELELFTRVFAEFNNRYDLMNNKLQAILGYRGPLTAADHELLADYFNLCAEEHFYYASGIVDSSVWCAWCRGMLQYHADPRIAAFWREEQSNGSYYGLTLKEIEAGARVKRPGMTSNSKPLRGDAADRKAA